MWVVGGGWGGIGVNSHFRVKPRLRLGWVELRLRWGFDNYCTSLHETMIFLVFFCVGCNFAKLMIFPPKP